MITISNRKYLEDAQLLAGRKKGDLYKVEDGHLKLMGFWDRLHYKIARCFLIVGLCHCFGKHAERVRASVKNVIDTVTPLLNGDQAGLTNFYFGNLSKLSRELYSRKLSDKSIAILSTTITETGIPAEATDDYRTALKVAKLQAKLGNFELLGNATSGSYCIFDEKEKRLGVCKFADEEQLALNNISWVQWMKRLVYQKLPSGKILFKCVAGQAFVAEAAAYVVGKYIARAFGKPDSSIVPETHAIKMPMPQKEDRNASFQLWVNEVHQFAREALNVKQNYKPLFKTVPNIPDELVDQVVIGDVIMGNMDRHGENWFYLPTDQEIRLIDGGHSFPPYHPRKSNWLLLRNMYLWRKLPQFQQPFSERGKTAIRILFSQMTNIKRDVQVLYDQYLPDKKGQNLKRVECLNARLSLLYFYQDEQRDHFAKLRTASAVEKAFIAS